MRSLFLIFVFLLTKRQIAAPFLDLRLACAVALLCGVGLNVRWGKERVEALAAALAIISIIVP
jgi:hypothetical protein